jgi:hypothetical protein
VLQRVTLLVVIVYVAGALLTFGKFYRDYKGALRPRHVAYAAAWPVWWLASVGLGGTLDAIGEATWGTEYRWLVSFSIGVFTAGYYLSENWSTCSGGACAGVLMKATALLITPVNLIYWGLVL